jgi:hypothetical protein
VFVGCAENAVGFSFVETAFFEFLSQEELVLFQHGANILEILVQLAIFVNVAAQILVQRHPGLVQHVQAARRGLGLYGNRNFLFFGSYTHLVRADTRLALFRSFFYVKLDFFGGKGTFHRKLFGNPIKFRPR